MTWFGIVMFVYYCLNMSVSLYYAGKGGIWMDRGGLITTVIVNIGFLLAILFVGTGLGVL